MMNAMNFDNMKRAGRGIAAPARPSPQHPMLEASSVMATRYPIVPGVRFKDIEGFPGYCVGDDGTVWSCRTNAGAEDRARWHRIKERVSPKGYLRLVIVSGRKSCSRFVHRLVAEAFISPQPTPAHQINHVDGRKTNNAVGNLEWVTASENHRHASKLGLKARGSGHGNAKLTEAQAREIRALKDVEKQRDTAKRYGVDQAIVGRIQRGVLWKHA